MQIVQRPSLCIQQHCPDRTRACAPSLLPPCSARHVTSKLPIPPCRTILQEGRSRRRGASCCSSSVTPLSDLTRPTDQALQLVRSLAEDLDSLKQKPLPSRCSLSIYRLTKLCNTSQDYEVALALTLVGCLLKFVKTCKFKATAMNDSHGMHTAQSRPCNCRTANSMTARVFFRI